MKYLKTFENYKPEPKKGDYIVVRLVNNPSGIARTLEKSIGRIIDTLLSTKSSGWSYKVKFGTTEWYIKREEIIDWSENKENLEHYINANKYNL